MTLIRDHDDQRSQRFGNKFASDAERSAWDSLKRFVDPPMGSFGARTNLEPGQAVEEPRSAHDLGQTVDLGSSVQLGLSSTHPLELNGYPASSSSSGGTSSESNVEAVPAIPVKPTWPDSIPSNVTGDGKKRRRRWPLVALVALLSGGAVVALAKPSILPVSVRRTLHVGSSTDGTEAVSTNTKNKTGSNQVSGSTSTVPSTRPKRAVKSYDPTMRLALGSVDQYWAKQFPEVYDETYKKLRGGVYAYSSDSRIPTCDGMNLPYLVLQQNAFYCPESDFIAWDDQGLFPRLEKKYGRFLLAIVLAHEWGHAIQERSDADLDTITAEQQADCFAGAWAASLNAETDPELTKLRDTELDKALSGFIEFRDLVGMVSTDPGAHGTAFDRIRAFQDGYEGTPTNCAYYAEELPELVAIPYRSFKERFRGGNLPYPEVLPSITKDLAANWKSVFSTAPVTTTASKDFPVCFAQPVSPEGFNEDTLSYCDDDKTLRYDEKSMRTLYDRIGDFGPATTVGIGWAMSDLVAQGKDPSTKAFWTEANCRAGAWAGTMFDSDNPEDSQLSPGDLDESVRTILESSAKGAAEVYGTGFEQVSAFRAGVLHGFSDCEFLVPAA